MDQVIDNKSVTPTIGNDSKEALMARIQAAEANPEVGKAHRLATDTVTSSVQESKPTTTPEGSSATPTNPPTEVIKGGLDQFKDKDGNVDDGKIRKANEHLERGIREREELVRKNKELLAKFTKTSQELKSTEREIQNPPPVIPSAPVSMSDDDAFLRRMTELDNNPLALRDLIRSEIKAGIAPIQGRLQSADQEADLRSKAAELQSIVDAGHSWIINNGQVDLSRFDEVFQERPYLLQGRTPYLDALRFMDTPNGSASAHAQVGTPILGGGSAVPPPSSAPTVTPEQKMRELSQKFRQLLSRGQRNEANEVMKEMERLNRGY